MPDRPTVVIIGAGFGGLAAVRALRRADVDVILIDLKHGDDMGDESTVEKLSRLDNVVGVLSAPPCTDFSGSGARWWPAKDADGRTKDELVLFARGIFMRHKSISLTVVSLDVQTESGGDTILATLHMLMGETALPQDKGVFYLEFEKEGSTKMLSNL